MSLGAYWRVTSGIIPGEVDTVQTFELSGEERGNGFMFHAKQRMVQSYVMKLETQCALGRAPNWITVDFVWL